MQIMIHINLLPEESDKIFNNFINGTHSKIRLKSLVVYMNSLNISHGKIIEICRITEPTLVNYLKSYKEGGLQALNKTSWKGQPSSLNQHKDLIEKDFSENPPHSIADARERIAKLVGIERSNTQIRYFLREKLKYRYIKSGSVPGNGKNDDADKESERQEFIKKNLTRCWMKQKKEKK